MKATANRIEMHYDLSGSRNAPAVMFCHALGASRSLWRDQAEALARRWRVLAYDLRGHGDSSANGDCYTLDQLADDAVALLDRVEIDRVHFVGISLGGMIAQHVALKHRDRLLSVTLCDTVHTLDDAGRQGFEERIATVRESGLEPLADATMERWFTEGFRSEHPDIVQSVRDQFLHTSRDGFIGCCRAITGLDNGDRLGDITTPALIVAGDRDPSSPRAVNETMRETIRGARLQFIDDAAHLANLAQPEQFNHVLTEFLGQVG